MNMNYLIIWPISISLSLFSKRFRQLWALSRNLDKLCYYLTTHFFHKKRVLENLKSIKSLSLHVQHFCNQKKVIIKLSSFNFIEEASMICAQS